MALTLSISQQTPGSVVTNRTVMFAVTVTNTSASAVTLNDVRLQESSHSGAQIGVAQGFLTPNVAPGVGNPVLGSNSSGTYIFPVSTSTMEAGPSPQHQPGGAAPSQPAQGPSAGLSLLATASASDGSVGSATVIIPMLASSSNDPPPEGGGLWLSQGNNLLNFLTM